MMPVCASASLILSGELPDALIASFLPGSVPIVTLLASDLCQGAKPVARHRQQAVPVRAPGRKAARHPADIALRIGTDLVPGRHAQGSTRISASFESPP